MIVLKPISTSQSFNVTQRNADYNANKMQITDEETNMSRVIDLTAVISHEEQIASSFGYMYNWYTAVDTKNIANPSGGNGQTNTWRVPSQSDFSVLSNYIIHNVIGYYEGGSYYGVNNALKTIGTTTANTGCWFAGAGTNILNFDGLPSGIRTVNGQFITAGTDAHYWTTTPHASAGYAIYVNLTSYLNYITLDISTLVNVGGSIRLVRNATASEQLLDNGTNSVDNPTQLYSYIGNDGKIYKTTKIGTQIWLAQDLLETKFNDLSNIPEVSSNGAWSELTTSARSTYTGYNVSLTDCTGINVEIVEVLSSTTDGDYYDTITTAIDPSLKEGHTYKTVLYYDTIDQYTWKGKLFCTAQEDVRDYSVNNDKYIKNTTTNEFILND